MRALRTFAMIVVAVLVAQLGAASAQPAPQDGLAKRFVGTWRLYSITVNGKPSERRGPQPTGILVYDAYGTVAAQIMADRPRPKFAASQPTPDEAKTALASYLAYFGTYTIDERAGTVTHHRTGHINPGAAIDVMRQYRFVGEDRLILAPAEGSESLTWDRIK